MPKVYIDGIEYETKPDRNMLEVALENGLDLPYFCWHPAMGSVGACRLCAVRVFKDENDTHGKIQMACMTPANDGIRISMSDPEATEFRRYVIEWLMTNHPHDCPVCDEGGECHLQDMTAMCGQVYRWFRFRKRTYTNQYLGPFITHEMNRCIQCYRCVRFYRDLAGGRDFDSFGSRNRVYFGRQKDGVLESEFSGNLVEVCPTGVFTDKTSARHYTRKWDLETAPSVCIHCGLGCNIIPGARYGTIRRVTSRFNSDVNGYFLCDRGRFGYEFANSDRRIRDCGIRNNGEFEKTSWEKAVERVKRMLSEAEGIIGIGSPRASLEANYALRKLVGKVSYSTGISSYEQKNAELALEILQNGLARTPSLGEVEEADVVLVLGVDPTGEAPMLDFAIRQAMRKAPLDIARKLKIPDWDANAVATALQGAKGKLYIASPWRIKIEEICAESIHIDPAETAGLLERIYDRLQSESSDDSIESRIAADLLEARQPLIVSGISAGADIIKSASNIAQYLCRQGKDCRLLFTAPEANTIGTVMLSGMSVQDAIEKVESSEADTIIVLENDLTRKLTPTQLRSLDKARNLIVLDCIHTRTSEQADAVLPAPSYFETDGTFVNNECRAQRFYQVFVPAWESRPEWWIFRELMQSKPDWDNYEDVLWEMCSEIPIFKPVLEAAPSEDWRSPADQKIARKPHRYTGRTAINANVTIEEPEIPHDSSTPFAFTMEGDKNVVPDPLVPRFWYSGWNSVQSINKFQIEVGGPLHGGNPGKRLIEPSGEMMEPFQRVESKQLSEKEIWVIPRPYIFGSEELSSIAPAIAELVPDVQLSVHPEKARRLGIVEGKIVEIETGRQIRKLLPKLDESLAVDVIIIPANMAETMGIISPTISKIVRSK